MSWWLRKSNKGFLRVLVAEVVALDLASRTFFSPGFCLGLIKRYCSVEYWNTSPVFQGQMCCFAWKGSEFYNQLHHFFISINNSLFAFVTICKNMSTTNCHRLSDSDWACTVVVRVMAWSDGLWWRKCWHSLCGKKKTFKELHCFSQGWQTKQWNSILVVRNDPCSWEKETGKEFHMPLGQRLPLPLKPEPLYMYVEFSQLLTCDYTVSSS